MSGSTGRTALTLVGQVVGAYIGAGPIGAAIGGVVGTLIGNALFPLDPVFGPKIGDLSLQGSSYGVTIPLLYVRARVAGNVFWKTDLRERANEEDVGGKGGPSQSQTTFTYDADFAIGLCEGEMAEILRIWADGRLMYDVIDPTNVSAMQSSGNFAARFTFYPGTETQLPDPTMEATEGVGNVPGYRGICYVVFRQFPLGDFGNRIPIFTFEVIQSSPPASPSQLLDVDLGLPLYRHVNIIPQQLEPIPIISAVNGVIRVLNNADAQARIYDLDGALIGSDYRTPFEDELIGVIDSPSGPFIGWWLGTQWVTVIDGWNTKFEDGARIYARSLTADDTISIDELTTGLPQTEVLMGFSACADYFHFIVYTGATPSGACTKWYLLRFDGTGAVLERSGTVDQATFPTAVTFGVSPIGQRNSDAEVSMLESNLTEVWQYLGASVLYVWSIDTATNIMSRVITFNDIALPLTAPYYGTAYLSMYADDGLAWLVGASASHPGFPNGTTVLNIYTRFGGGPPNSMTVGQIVSLLSQRAGLTVGQLDTATLTELCDGIVVGRSSTARAVIESMSGVFTFAGVESEGKLRFAIRGGASVATIEEDHLGATANPDTESIIESERTQETELPSRVTLRYIALEASYQTGAQSARRVTTGSVQVIESDIPVVMTDARAAQGADVLMRESWIARNKRTFSTTRRWTALEPNDVVTLPLTVATYVVRLVTKREFGPLINWESVDHDVAVYESVAVGAPVPGTQSLSTEAPSRLMMMDIPLLRDVDDDAGIYGVAYALGTGPWSGANIRRADASSGPFTDVASSFTEATVGRASTALGNFTLGNVFDFSNTVDVQIFNGTLASITRSQVINNGNYALLGDELIQFQTAVLLSGSTYRLSNFLRARKGTDAAMSTHAAGDRFVLLEASKMVRVPVALDQVGGIRYYRGVTFGSLGNPIYDELLTQTGAAIKPLSPGNLVATRRLEDDDVVIRWHRRARISPAWRDLVDVPLDETTEAYEVDIYDETNTTFLRTISVTTNEATYTSAQQTADGSPASFYIRVYQMSDRVGRGFVSQILL